VGRRSLALQILALGMLVQLAVTAFQSWYLWRVTERAAKSGATADRSPRPAALPKLPEPVSTAGTADRVFFEQQMYDTFTTDAAKGVISFHFQDQNKNKLESLGNLRTFLSMKRQNLLFATNAGMFSTAGEPLGLYVEHGKEVYPLNRRSGTGNFYIKPNGVFLISDHGAFIIESEDYPTLERIVHVEYATQSGPLLVHQAGINHKFSPNSTSKNIRSGVGILQSTTVVFAISEDPVTLTAFARLFRLRFGCSEALYLDGSISKMYLPDLRRFDEDGSFAAMIAVSRPISN
jgi:uncharacterized protein YigE (DUF2233 family)